MINIYETFDSEEDAEAFKERYYQNYHPWGYGTHIDIDAPDAARAKDADKWVASGYRSASCD